PWKLRESDPERMRTVMHVVLQLVDDAKTLLTPFLPRSSAKVHAMLGGQGAWSGTPRIEQVDEEGGPSYPVITGDYDSPARWESAPVRPGARPPGPEPRSARLAPSATAGARARREKAGPRAPAPPAARPPRPACRRRSRCRPRRWTATATWR